MSELNSETGKKILIIDDEAANLAVVEGYLSSFGYDTFTALDGKKGMEMLQKVCPNLVILDINLPDKDGFQIMKEIKEIPIYANIPIVFLSGFDRPNFKVKALELGADDYITRPFNKAELLARIRAVLRRSHLCNTVETDAMTGNLLDHMGLVELLQPLEIGKRTAYVKLKDIDAELIIKDGLLVFIRQGIFTGLDALDRILFGEKGRFSITFSGITNQKESKPIQLTKAIMDSISYLDEVKSLINGFIPTSQLKHVGITITSEIKALKGAEKFNENQVIPIVDLIMALQDDLKDVAMKLLKMNRSQTLKIKSLQE